MKQNNWILPVIRRCSVVFLLLSCIFLNASADPPVVISNSGYRLVLNGDNGAIESFEVVSDGARHDLLIASHYGLPLFKAGLMTDDIKFREINSSQAKKITIWQEENRSGKKVVIRFTGISELNLNAEVTVECPADKPLTYWSLQLENTTKMSIGHIQFPVVEVPYDATPAEENGSHIVYSVWDGNLTGAVKPGMSLGPWTRTVSGETWREPNYPKECTIQMMAYYNKTGGLYISSEDPAGTPKLIAPMLDYNGVMLGMGHFPGTKGPKNVKLSYKVALGTFQGDWHSAAAIYRDWAEKQSFLPPKIRDRPDYPKWLRKPVVGVTYPMRGQGDWDPPATINTEYTPATNALPYLNKLSEGFNAPLMPVIFNWEHSGPWVQPEAFPPLGGEDSMKAFMEEARKRDWHPVLYGDGLHWVFKQNNTGYDGMPYFKANGGDSAMVRHWSGTIPNPSWGWRSSYSTCVATPAARRMVLGMTRGMAELGPAVIQQFDQGAGAVSCYATDHGHPTAPGPWMTENFRSLLEEDNELARSIDPGVAISSEGAPPEVYLKYFDLWDARTIAAGDLNIPLYSFIYHEYINGHSGSYNNSVNDEALRGTAAKAFVNGYFLNFTLRDKGQISYEWDKLWYNAIPDQRSIISWANMLTELRYGLARKYLLDGRMMKPWKVSHVSHRDFGMGEAPIVESCTWKAPDGNVGVVLANYGSIIETPKIELKGSGKAKVMIYVNGDRKTMDMVLPAELSINMPPRTLGLIEVIQPE